MRRPLCVVAVCIFAIQIFALYMPQQAYLPIAAIFSCAFLLSFKTLKKRRYYQISLALATVAFAILWRAGYHNLAVKPSLSLVGAECQISAQVSKANIYESGIMSAELTVKDADIKALKGKSVLALNIPQAKEGEVISLRVKLQSITPSQTAHYYSRGVFLSAKYIGGFKPLESGTFSPFFLLREKLSQSYKALTKEATGIIGSAMAFGDKALLTSDIKESFRTAGLSHMLVVSGMHLAAFSGLIFTLCGLILVNRRAKAAISIIFTILFILLTGITPSSVRAGVMLCVVYSGMCFWRQADTITSLCAALALLTLQNPFIVMDMGFLLSFAATAGIVGGNIFIEFLRQKGAFKNKLTYKIIKVLGVPLSAGLATAPVLIFFGAGVSIMGLLFNIIAVPLLPFIVALVFAASLLNLAPWLYYAARLAAIISAVLINSVNFIAATAQWLPFSMVYLKGFAAAAVLPLAALIAYTGFKLRVKRIWAFVSVFVLASSISITLINLNTVSISAVTNAQASPIVIYNNGTASIIFRAKPKIDKNFLGFLKQNNIKNVELVVLLDDFEVDEALSALSPQKVISTSNFSFNSTIKIFNDIIINIKKQKGACAVLVDFKGIRLAASRGTYDFNALEFINLYIAGQSRAENLNAQEIVVNNSVPKWLLDSSLPYTLSANAEITVRPGISYKINEGYYELD